MDTTIQSLTQSGIVQTLGENQEHSVKRFTHDIPDNAPYRSFNKITVKPFIGNSSPDSTLRFRIQRSGYLNKMTLRLVVDTTTAPEKDNEGEKVSGAEFFASVFTSASIYIGGNLIETLYPENILFKSFQLKNPTADHVIRGLKGVGSALLSGALGDSDIDLSFDVSPDVPSKYVFEIPLDFSCMQFYKDALDTNFLQGVEIEVKKRAMRVRQTSINAKTTGELVCRYHNVHHHLRNQIRNTNFSKETTTLLTTSNYLLVDSGVKEQIAEVAPSGTNLGYSAHGRTTFNLNNLDLFVSDILITFRKINQTPVVEAYFGDVVSSPSSKGFMKFILMANGRVIFEKFHYEMTRQHMNRSSFHIGDHCVEAQATKIIGHTDSQLGNNSLMSDTTELDILDQNSSFYIHRSAPSMYRIPLSLFSSDEFLCGGLNLKSLSNVKLIIEGEGLLPEVLETDHKGLVPQIVFRHKKLLRVDTKTGTFSV